MKLSVLFVQRQRQKQQERHQPINKLTAVQFAKVQNKSKRQLLFCLQSVLIYSILLLLLSNVISQVTTIAITAKDGVISDDYIQ